MGDSGVDGRGWMRVRVRGLVVLGEVKAVEVRERGVENAVEGGPSERREEEAAVTGDSTDMFLNVTGEVLMRGVGRGMKVSRIVERMKEGEGGNGIESG